MIGRRCKATAASSTMVRAVGPKAKAATAAMASAFSAGYRGGPPPREGEGVWLRAPPNMSEAAFREALPTLAEIERSQHDNAEYAASSSQERARVAIWAMLAEELRRGVRRSRAFLASSRSFNSSLDCCHARFPSGVSASRIPNVPRV